MSVSNVFIRYCTARRIANSLAFDEMSGVASYRWWVSLAQVHRNVFPCAH
jgi:hypothetical protein